MKSIHVGLLLLVLALSWSFAVPALAQNAEPGADELILTVQSGESGVEIEGGVPGATVVVFGISHRRSGIFPVTTRIDLLAVADAAGRAEVATRYPVEPMSVWFAVDLDSGALAVTVLPDLPLEIEKPGRGLGNAASVLEDQRQFLHLLLVRPAPQGAAPSAGESEAGAWGALIGDGGGRDRDGVVNGRLELSFLDLEPLLDGPPAPERLAPGDVIVGVDSVTLQFYAQRLAAPPAGSASASAGGRR